MSSWWRKYLTRVVGQICWWFVYQINQENVSNISLENVCGTRKWLISSLSAYVRKNSNESCQRKYYYKLTLYKFVHFKEMEIINTYICTHSLKSKNAFPILQEFTIFWCLVVLFDDVWEEFLIVFCWQSSRVTA